MNRPAGGSLTAGELERVGQMLAAGRMRSDPAVLSATDRVLDSMIERRARRKRARPDPPTQDQREPTPSQVPPSAGRLERDWHVARTLEELLDVRRELLGPPTRRGDEA